MNKNYLSKILKSARDTNAVGVIFTFGQGKEDIFADIDLYAVWFRSHRGLGNDWILRFQKTESTSDEDLKIQVNEIKTVCVKYE